MHTRHTWIAGLLALGCTLSAPALASLDEAFMVARHERGNEPSRTESNRDEARPAQRDEHKTRAPRETAPDESQGYGYGYERRQQQPETGERARRRH